jgi:hypothetical protein
MSPEWVTGPEQGESSGWIATFSLWKGVFWDGISSIPDETVIPLRLDRHCLVYGNRVYHEKVAMTVEYERLRYYASLALAQITKELNATPVLDKIQD